MLDAMTDEVLERKLRELAKGEKQALVSFLKHLAEFDRREAHKPRGYPSLFQYCVRELELSEDEAYLRIRAARLSLDHPEVLDMLEKGETHLISLVKLAPHLALAGAKDLLAEARGKSRREVERIVARYGTDLPLADTVRPLPPSVSGRHSPADPDGSRALPGVLAPADPLPHSPEAVEGLESGAPASGTPTGAARMPAECRLVRISFTATEELLLKIERAKALMRHKYPAGRLEQIVGEAIEMLLAKRDPDRRQMRSRHGVGRQAEGGAGTRRIPQWVKDEVWRRDGGRCAFVSADGTRCPSTQWLEYDHVLPWALGGTSVDPCNVRLLCRTHNQHAAERAFGRRWKAKDTRQVGARATDAPRA